MLRSAATGRGVKNRNAEWGNYASDRRRVFNTSLVVNSPKYSCRLMQIVAGNWQESSIFTYASGSWLTMTSGTDRLTC